MGGGGGGGGNAEKKVPKACGALRERGSNNRHSCICSARSLETNAAPGIVLHIQQKKRQEAMRPYLGHAYTETVSVGYLKVQFNRGSCFLLDKLTQGREGAGQGGDGGRFWGKLEGVSHGLCIVKRPSRSLCSLCRTQRWLGGMASVPANREARSSRGDSTL